jgi:hypothetical protein
MADALQELEDSNILPESFIIPEQYEEFEDTCEDLKNHNEEVFWIVKPSAGRQGKGIYITNSHRDVNPTDNVVVSQYINNPLLINGYKFDLRIYVCVTSFEPLRIYVY